MASGTQELGSEVAFDFKKLPSAAKQDLLLEFASLKQACPDGVFVTITPGNISLWNCVLFVRKGPYAPSILRFQMSFPAQYPSLPPLITFTSDIFHPLLTPLTTYTYTNSAASDDTVSASDQERLPPGGISLRFGFPGWFTPSRNSIQRLDQAKKRPVSVYQILEYIRFAFNDEACLDSIPLNAAANPGAYHAWNNYRARQASRATSPHSHPSSKRNSGIEHLSGSNEHSRGRRPGEWNWDGVWEDRVRRGIHSTISEQALFGTGMDEIIRFSTLDNEGYKTIIAEIERRDLNPGQGQCSCLPSFYNSLWLSCKPCSS
jgi:Ubiquitin-conjugating enzyme